MNNIPTRVKPLGGGWPIVDRSGCRHGRLMITHPTKSESGKWRWNAICDCGNSVIISAHQVRSCGCLRRETTAKLRKNKKLPDHIRIANRKANAARHYWKARLDPVHVMHTRISKLHRWALRRVNGIKSSRTLEALGYSAQELVAHIEKQFLTGMSWNNMHQWHIDHIFPMSTAKTPEDVIALNQLSNLRPLWSKDNLKKHAKVDFLL